MSGTVDTAAIIGRPMPAPPNLLEMASNYQNLQNAQAQNALIKQHTANARLDNETNQQSLAQKMAQRHAQLLFGISNLPDDRIGAAARNLTEQEFATGQVDQKRRDTALAMLDATGGDPSKIREMINSGLVGNLAGPEAIAVMRGSVKSVDQGPQLQGVVQGGIMSPDAGKIMPQGAAIPIGGPTNAQLALARSPMVDSEGNPSTVPTPVLPQYLRPGQPGAAPGPAPAYSPANPPRLGEPQAPPGQTPGELRTGLAPGNTAPMEASGAQYASAQTNAANFGQRMVPLQRALALSAETPTGPGTEWLNHMKAYLLSGAQQFGFTPSDVSSLNKITDYQELNKYLQQAVASNPMAASSDARLASVFAGSPNVHINQLAVQDTLKTQIALERMSNAAFSTYTGAPNAYGPYAAHFAASVDPRAFEVDLMTAAQKDAVAKSLKTPQDRQRFADSLKIARTTFQNNAMPVQ